MYESCFDDPVAGGRETTLVLSKSSGGVVANVITLTLVGKRGNALSSEPGLVTTPVWSGSTVRAFRFTGTRANHRKCERLENH